MDHLRDIRNMLQACEDANEGEREVAMRRASGFHELFEAALNKECLTKAEKSKLNKGNPSYNEGLDTIQSEVKTLIRMCTTDPSRKWTWGVDLTEADVDRLIRGADRYSPEHPHSGYDTDLASGSLPSVTSSIDPSKLEDPEDSVLFFDNLSPDFPFIPDLADGQHPPIFSFQMINSFGQSVHSSQSDSVLQAFIARAITTRTKNKLVLQQEVDEPVAKFESGSGSDHSSDADASQNIRKLSLIRRRPRLGPPAFIPPILPPAVIELSTSTANFKDCEIPGDFYVLPPSEDDEMLELEQVAEPVPMDICTEASIIADPNAESDVEIPETCFILNSDDNTRNSSDEAYALSPIPVRRDHLSVQAESALTIPRDPVTGQFTADSFTSFLDKFMD